MSHLPCFVNHISRPSHNTIPSICYEVCDIRRQLSKEIYDSCDKIRYTRFNCINNARKERNDTIPNIHKELLNTIPCVIPSCTKPTTNHIQNTKQCVTDILEPCNYSIPNGLKDSLNCIPGAFPVSCKDCNKEVQNTENHIYDCIKRICNILENSFKYRREKITETFPNCFQNFTNIFKIESKLIQPINNSLAKLIKRSLNLIPDCGYFISKLFICFPQSSKCCNQRTNNCYYSNHWRTYSSNGSLYSNQSPFNCRNRSLKFTKYRNYISDTRYKFTYSQKYGTNCCSKCCPFYNLLFLLRCHLL